NFITLKKKIAFRYIEEQKFEKAADLLISTEVNPEEVLCLFTWPSSVNIMSNNVVLHDGYQFLEEYLMQVREMHFALQSRANVDTSLLKLFTLHNKLEDVFHLENFHPYYEESAEFLESTGHYNYAAKMWLLAGETSKAWDFWRRLWLWRMEMPRSIRDEIERIPSKMLDGDAKLLRIYLESVPFSEEIAKELCDVYIKDIHSGDLNCRHRFRRLLLNMSFSDRTAVYDRIPSGCGVERLLCDNSQSVGDILDKLVNVYHDYDAAELICAHYSPTQPDICLNLLKFLEDRGSEFAVTSGTESRISSLLKCMGDAVDPLKVSHFLKRAVAKKQQEQHLLNSKESLLEKCAETEKDSLSNKKIVLSCAVCSDPISCNDVLCYLKTGYVVHSKCMKYENLCPLTNFLLVPPE
ncbi:hypothetical protein OSTOST_01158, partial [Ostertagia ostertagi]